MKASYWQRGESLDYKNETDSTIEANTVIALSGRVGIAGTDIAPGETGSLHVTGIYEMTKTGTAAIEMGAAVYFDGSGITDDTSGTAAGYAAATADAGDTTILVKLQG